MTAKIHDVSHVTWSLFKIVLDHHDTASDLNTIDIADILASDIDMIDLVEVVDGNCTRFVPAIAPHPDDVAAEIRRRWLGR